MENRNLFQRRLRTIYNNLLRRLSWIYYMHQHQSGSMSHLLRYQWDIIWDFVDISLINFSSTLSWGKIRIKFPRRRCSRCAKWSSLFISSSKQLWQSEHDSGSQSKLPSSLRHIKQSSVPVTMSSGVENIDSGKALRGEIRLYVEF